MSELIAVRHSNVYNFFVCVSTFEKSVYTFFVIVSTFENECLQLFCPCVSF